jgi:cytochrome b561
MRNSTPNTSHLPDLAAKAYSNTAYFLHWLMALLVFANFAIGLYMENFEKNTPPRDAVLFYHASIGSLIFMLLLARLLWRLTHRPAALPAQLARWQVLSAHLLHWTLYALLLLVPFTGYLHRLAGAHPVNFFGLGELPVFIDKNEPLRLLTDTLHVSLVWALAVLVIGHILAALKHLWVDRDGIATRMLRRP